MSAIATCPICRTPVRPTTRGNVGYHLGSISREVCPAYGQPWRITGVGLGRVS